MTNRHEKISLKAALAGDRYPLRYTFEDGTLKGLTIHYRALPEDWADVVAEEIGDELAALGFDPAVAIHKALRGAEVTDEEQEAYDAVVDAMPLRDRAQVDSLMKRGLARLLTEIVGSWDATDCAPDFDTLLSLPATFLGIMFGLAHTGELLALQKKTDSAR